MSAPHAGEDGQSTPAFNATFTLDEFRVLQTELPELTLPASLDVGTIADSVGDGSADERRERAVESLRATCDPTDPLLRLALTLPVAAEYSIHVQAWTPSTTSQTMVALNPSVTSVITIMLPRDTTADFSSPHSSHGGTVQVTLGSRSIIVGELLSLLDEAPAEPARVEPTTVRIGVVESRSLIEAIKQGDAEVVEQLALQFQAADALPLLRPLAATMEARFRMHVFAQPGRPVFSTEWFQASTTEWVTARLSATAEHSDGKVTAQTITDTEIGRAHV